MSCPSSSSWRTLNVRGRPKEPITLSLRPNTRDSRSTQSHGNERMPSLVGNLVVALGRGRSRLPAPPWLALLVPVSAKSCLFFFFFSGTLPRTSRVNTGFLHEAECNQVNRGTEKKKAGLSPRSIAIAIKHIVALSDERAMARVIQTRRAAAASAAANEMSPKKKLLLKARRSCSAFSSSFPDADFSFSWVRPRPPPSPPPYTRPHYDLQVTPTSSPPPSTHTRRRRGEEERAHESRAFGTWCTSLSTKEIRYSSRWSSTFPFG